MPENDWVPVETWVSIGTSSASLDTIWNTWITATNSASNTTVTNLTYTPITYAMDYGATARSTAESLQAARAARAAQVEEAHEHYRRLQEREAERVERRLAAEAAAAELFLFVLSPEERAQYQRDQHYVDIRGGETGLKYRIRLNMGIVGNVSIYRGDRKIYRGDRKIASLCCHPRDTLPQFDMFAGQVLAIKHEEKDFLAKANICEWHTYADSSERWLNNLKAEAICEGDLRSFADPEEEAA
jgi:hypothetical protein